MSEYIAPFTADELIRAKEHIKKAFDSVNNKTMGVGTFAMLIVFLILSIPQVKGGATLAWMLLCITFCLGLGCTANRFHILLNKINRGNALTRDEIKTVKRLAKTEEEKRKSTVREMKLVGLAFIIISILKTTVATSHALRDKTPFVAIDIGVTVAFFIVGVIILAVRQRLAIK